MRSVILALAIAAVAGGVAQAGEPQTSFQTTTGKSRVPVTPKVTISSANTKSGMKFNSDGTLKTHRLPSGRTVGDANAATGK